MIEKEKINMFVTAGASNVKAQEAGVLSATEMENPKQNPPTLAQLQACLESSQVTVESKAAPLRITRCNPEVEDILNDLSADMPYSDWILVAAAIKNEGGNWEMFSNWSKTAPKRYDEDVARKTWESMGGPEHPEITLGTLRFLQNRYNIKAIPAPIEMTAPPENDEEFHKQRIDFLNTLFLPNESIELITPVQNNPAIPDRPGLRGEVNTVLQKFEQQEALNGAWVVLNPVAPGNTAANDDAVTDYRYVLVESDEGEIVEQWNAVASLPVLPPVVSVVWSGGKSLHFIIRIDAANKEEYKERVKRLYAYLEEQKIPVDKANKNPSRMTRLAGVKRGEGVQWQLAGAFGCPNWQSFAFRLDGNEPKKIDGRRLTSAANGQNGGRPSIDIADIGIQILDTLATAKQDILYWNEKFWFYRERWSKFSYAEGKAKLSKLIQQEIKGSAVRFSAKILNDVFEWMKGQKLLELDECPKQPYLLEQHQSGEDYMIFANGAVRLKELKEKGVEGCTLLPMSSNIFGEPDVDFMFDPNAKCPMWEDMVKKMFPEESERIMFQQCFGYIISRSVAMNTAFIWYGIPGTAKSTASDIIRWLVGEKKCSALPFAELRDKFSTIMLTENYLNLTEEFPTGGSCKGQENAEGTFKTATCGGTLKIERKGKTPGVAHATARFIFCGNDLPTFMDKEAIWDRLVIISFEHVFRKANEEQIKFSEKLKSELPGIFNWAVEGMQSLGDMPRFPATEKSKKLLAEHKKRCNVEETFITENLEADTDATVKVSFLWERYVEYCAAEGLPQKSQATLVATIRKMFPDSREGHQYEFVRERSIRFIKNVKFKSEEIRKEEQSPVSSKEVITAESSAAIKNKEPSSVA